MRCGVMQKTIIELENTPCIAFAASVGGSREYEGPLGGLLDAHDEDNSFGQPTWEKSEAEMQRQALNLALAKGKLQPDSLDALFAGDLINQCTSSAYGLLSFDVPYIGLYGACSTAAEGIAMAAMTVNAGYFKRAAAVTSSHNGSAERQFRYPLEYGGQRSPTAQWTVTGSAAFIIEGGERGLYGAFLREVMFGRTLDRGINDAGNMGAAMAPAAADTLLRYFKASKLRPENFDLIVTGDLGSEGHSILLELTSAGGLDLSKVCSDCGMLIYDQRGQDVHSGGSGCGCSAVVLAAELLRRIKEGEIKDMLFVGTGALMSPDALKQGQSIPGVAHLVRISSARN